MRSRTDQNRLVALGVLILLGAPFSIDASHAQANYPDRPIRIVANTPAGGASDSAARLLGESLFAAWGKAIVVESIVGAGGNLAASHVAKAAPDGHTLIMSGEAAIVTNISLYKSMPFDPVNDLRPISQVAIAPNILVVHADLPVKSLKELVALARANPGKFSYAHGGIGFSQHIAGEVLRHQASIDIQQVPYRGSQAIMPDLIAGRVTMCFCNINTVLPQVREGKLRAIAITSHKRSESAPDIVTVSEAGFPTFDINSWFGLLAPAATPTPIIAKLHDQVVKSLANSELRQKYRSIGMEVVANSPTEFAAIINSEIPRRRQVIEAAGIPLQ